MIVVDILILIVVVCGVAVGAPFLAKKIALRNPKTKVLAEVEAIDERGDVNALRLERAERRRCTVCHNMTSPDRDILIATGWIHSPCFLDMHNKDKHHA